jgi:hypothetical protein
MTPLEGRDARQEAATAAKREPSAFRSRWTIADRVGPGQMEDDGMRRGSARWRHADGPPWRAATKAWTRRHASAEASANSV